uniref:Malic enzyme 3 n=1 Tax=Ornithorhynchus anatinus TaxID=9258 RepID=A0A6I8PEV2_ORNAN
MYGRPTLGTGAGFEASPPPAPPPGWRDEGRIGQNGGGGRRGQGWARLCAHLSARGVDALYVVVGGRPAVCVRVPRAHPCPSCPRPQGMAFTLGERLQLGIHGLLPPCFLSQDVQLLRVMRYYERQPSDLDKYIILMTLQDRNEKLFYRVLTSDVEKFMPIVYTPTVGQACQQYGLTFRRPRGLFITIHDKGHIATMLNSWPEDNIKAVVVTDGERILGLGDLGSYGMGIPVGKLALYSACGGINPQHCLPVLLDVGTDNQELLRDPLYIGLKHRRVRGEPYDQLLDEFMQAVTDKYGISCLIQFEDFANANAFRLLNKYRDQYCMFNDDIQESRWDGQEALEARTLRAGSQRKVTGS